MKTIRVAVLIAAFSTLAAAEVAPTTRPATRSAQDVLGQMLRPTTQSAPPLRPIPGYSGMVDITSGQGTVPGGATTQATMREGAFIVDRAGRMTRTPDSKDIQFTFDADGRNLTDPPVVLLPNLNLMKMEAAIGGTNSDIR